MARGLRTVFALAACCLAVPAPAVAADTPLQIALAKVAATDSSLAPGTFPVYTQPGGAWLTADARHWASGYLPGELWLAYEATHDASWRTRAEARQATIAAQRTRTDTQDLGVMFVNSFARDYDLTGDTTARAYALQAAASQATRWNDVVGLIRSWDSPAPTFKVIVDSLTDLELLLWAAKNGGGDALRTKAVAHGLKIIQTHLRPDGSTYHLVVFDQTNGSIIERTTAQGAGPETTWARGQAWAVYGFSLLYRETGDARFLDAARRTADWWIAHVPADRVPWWDFSKAGIATEPRDSSAAAIAADGMLTLAAADPDAARAAGYRTAAVATVDSLSANYLDRSGTSAAILLHGTANRPANQGVDAGIPYGDFHYLRALIRIGGGTAPPPPPPPPTSYASTITADAPAAYWRLGETTGTRANDVLGRSPGTYTGAGLGQAGLLTGDADRAVLLNGTTGRITVAATTALATADTFTLEAWVKRRTQNRAMSLFARATGGYELYIDSANKLTLRKLGTGDIAKSTVTITAGTAYHVVATKQGAAVHLYVNGVDRTGPVTNRAIANVAGALYLGTGAGYLDGYLDEAAVYPRALDAAAVARHWTAGRR